MATTREQGLEAPHSPAPAPAEARPAEAGHVAPVAPPSPRPASRSWRNWLLLGILVVGLGIGIYLLRPWVVTALDTVSTDDAYVNGHVTFVAPRVAGKVVRVLVDDNMRVKKGDLLAVLDKEPYQVQVDIQKAGLETAQANLDAAQAKVRGLIAQARGSRFKMDHAIEEVHNQIALLKANVAAYQSKQANLELARANLQRGEKLVASGGISKEALNERQNAVEVAQAAVQQALEEVHQVRAGLGLLATPPKGEALDSVPDDLDQTYSSVRQTMAEALQSVAQLGFVPTTYNGTPKEIINQFYALDPEKDVDRIYAMLAKKAPLVMQAQAKLQQAQHDLDQAELNLHYCDVPAEIDGVVTRRNVNPGDFVQVGQNLMAVRSLTEIWIDANFKETQLANLRIGQRARIEVDMYGRHQEFEGRITGFTMGTGQTLALLPAQNATGNYVKIVQRLPVRIELTDYDPDKVPLFVGLSVTPYVYYKEPATGDNAGKFLQPVAPLPQVAPLPGAGESMRPVAPLPQEKVTR